MKHLILFLLCLASLVGIDAYNNQPVDWMLNLSSAAVGVVTSYFIFRDKKK